GAIGFKLPLGATPADQELYRSKLHQVPYDPHMLLTGNYSGHVGPTMPHFVATSIAPILKGQAQVSATGSASIPSGSGPVRRPCGRSGGKARAAKTTTTIVPTPPATTENVALV